MHFIKNPITELFSMSFNYKSKYGHFFKQGEKKIISFAIKNTCGQDLDVYLDANLVSYYGKKVFTTEYHVFLKADSVTVTEFEIDVDGLGYYDLFCMVKSPSIWATERTGVAVIRDVNIANDENSPFGLCCNYWASDRQMPVLKRMGAKHLRLSPQEALRIDNQLKEHGLYAMCQQVGGKVGDLDYRFAPPKQNSSYYYTKNNSQIYLQEHGNECWEEHDLTLLSEWTKVSHLAKIKANPSGFYAPSGIAGSDFYRFEHFFKQGLHPYISYIGIHPYTFPKAPEFDAGFWSFEGLKKIAKLIDNYGALPVIASEQGYPTIDNQEVCEAYSPGDMVTKEAQADYLVRKYVLLLSYGVSKILWFNGPWYNGFGIIERDGMAPLPAAVAFCEMTRKLDLAEYVGDIMLEDNGFCKVFNKKGKAIAVAWRPVLKSRSFRSEYNYTLDGKHRESEGIGLEGVDYTFYYATSDTVVTDIFGNKVEFEITDNQLTVCLGESPIYIENLHKDIFKKAAENSLVMFTAMKQKEIPLPPEIILGIQDKNPCKGAYYTAQILPSGCSDLVVRIHNYSKTTLKDKLNITLPKGFSAKLKTKEIQVPAGEMLTVEFEILCEFDTPVGVYEIYAYLENCNALDVMQYYKVVCPFSITEIINAPENIKYLELNYFNPTDKDVNYNVNFSVEGLDIAQGEIFAKADSTGSVMLNVRRSEKVIGATGVITLFNKDKNAKFTVGLPIRYIKTAKNWDKSTLQPLMVAGPYTQANVLEKRTGPELTGEAKPDSSIIATVKMAVIENNLKVHFDVVDDDIILVQNTRRNNVDCDGIWFELYDSSDDKAKYRFCMTPADPSYNAENRTIKEFSSDEFWKEPYSEFDLSVLKFSSQLWLKDTKEHKKGYTMTLEIPLDSVGISINDKNLYAGIRIIDMDADDWPQFYDTGKLKFTL